MKVYRDLIQGTSAWAEARCGIPTASQFHRIITGTGKPSSSADTYMYELLAERITGEPTVGYTSHWMDRGSDLEAEAVNFYSFTRDLDTEKVGFITNDDGSIGASPDRLVGDVGLLEIKVCKPSTHVAYLLGDKSTYKEHKIQTQGQLWIAEREWNDLVAYNPCLPPALVRVERDEEYIKTLSAAVTAFSELLEQQYALLAEMGLTVRPEQPVRTPSLVELLKQSLIEINRNAEQVQR